jgi:hypothetical protein
MSSTLDALREQTAEVDGPAVTDALRRSPGSGIDAIAERLLASPARPVRRVGDNEVRPLVNARSSLLSGGAQGFVDGVGPAGLSVTGAMDPRQIGSNTFSDGVIRVLLYSHGLVVEDPVLAMRRYRSGCATSYARRVSTALRSDTAETRSPSPMAADAPSRCRPTHKGLRCMSFTGSGSWSSWQNFGLRVRRTARGQLVPLVVG